jgi:hypothetical protein
MQNMPAQKGHIDSAGANTADKTHANAYILIYERISLNNESPVFIDLSVHIHTRRTNTSNSILR